MTKIRMVGAEVIDLDTDRAEAKIEITLNEEPSDLWVGMFLEAVSNGLVDLKLAGNTMTFWHRAETGSLVKQAEAVRALIERANVKVELELRTLRQREEWNRQRIQDLSRGLRNGLGLSDDGGA